MTNAYVVARGDTLTKIAAKFNTTVDALASLNHIANPDHISVGQSIKVPAIALRFVDKANHPIPGLTCRLWFAGQCQVVDSDQNGKTPYIFTTTDIKVEVKKPDGTFKPIGQVRQSHHPKTVEVRSPKAKVTVTTQTHVPAKHPRPKPATMHSKPSPPPAAPKVEQRRGPDSHPIAHVSDGQLEKSGAAWHAKFRESKSTADLIEPFKSNVEKFLAAMKAAGISVRISTTHRPVERSYLMHYASQIVRGKITADKVPAWPGVNIDWSHKDAAGKADLKAAKHAAADMVRAYGLGNNPVAKPGRSNHNKRQAIDMTITNYERKTIIDADGNKVKIGSWHDLKLVGKTYDVIWFGARDRPHWSPTGR
nr:LysM domain-containing protein [Chitinivorax tropicus]